MSTDIRLDPRMPSPSACVLPRILARFAETRGDDLFAVFDDSVRWAYRETFDQSLAVPDGLARLGISQGETLLIWLPNGRMALNAWFGTNCLGAVSVAINTAYRGAILQHVEYRIGSTHVGTTAEEAVEAGSGVCQDHAHIFVGAARMLDIPARYVSGYLMMNDRIDQEATHAWAEAHIEGLGWVGFDISNGISPDARYVRVATGPGTP